MDILSSYLPEHLINAHITPLITPNKMQIMPTSLDWWNDGFFIEEVTQIYNVFQSGFFNRVYVHPTVDVNWSSLVLFGSYKEVLSGASFDELVEGFPGDKIVLDYTYLFKNQNF